MSSVVVKKETNHVSLSTFRCSVLFVLTLPFVQDIEMTDVDGAKEAGPSSAARPIRRVPSVVLPPVKFKMFKVYRPDAEEKALDARHATAYYNRANLNRGRGDRAPYREAEFNHAPRVGRRVPNPAGVRFPLDPPKVLVEWRAVTGRPPVSTRGMGRSVFKHVDREAGQWKRKNLGKRSRMPVKLHPEVHLPYWFGKETRQRGEMRDGYFVVRPLGQPAPSEGMKTLLGCLRAVKDRRSMKMGLEGLGEETLVIAKALLAEERDEELVQDVFEDYQHISSDPTDSALVLDSSPFASPESSTAIPPVDGEILVTPRYSAARGRDLGWEEDDEFEDEAFVENYISVVGQDVPEKDYSANLEASMAIDSVANPTDLASTIPAPVQLTVDQWRSAVAGDAPMEDVIDDSTPSTTSEPAAPVSNALKLAPTLLQDDMGMTGSSNGLKRGDTILQPPMTNAQRLAIEARFGRTRVVKSEPTIMHIAGPAAYNADGTSREGVYIEMRASFLGPEQEARTARARAQRLMMSAMRRT